MKYSQDILRTKRTIKEAKLFCEQVFNSISKEEFKRFRLKRKNGNDSFNKDFWEEYYPLSLYSSLKYNEYDYLIFLCRPGSKIDAKIIDKTNNLVESIQITTTLDYNDSLKNEKLLKNGFALGVGSFERNKDGSISQSRGMRSEEGALYEESYKILKAINNKLANDTYKNIDVLLVATESRLNKAIQNYYKKLKNILRSELHNKTNSAKNKFKEIFLIDFSSELLKL